MQPDRYKRNTPQRIIDIIEEHRRIAADALRKVEAEGSVVRTLKGDVIAHPALKIHAEASKAESLLLEKWTSRT
jgi:hypothetical protein